eukprot:9217809-Alexandrium_andersonii.AAC.1
MCIRDRRDRGRAEECASPCTLYAKASKCTHAAARCSAHALARAMLSRAWRRGALMLSAPPCTEV